MYRWGQAISMRLLAKCYNKPLTQNCTKDTHTVFILWRGGREAEGGGLLNRYTGYTRIVGSNPILSTIPNNKNRTKMFSFLRKYLPQLGLLAFTVLFVSYISSCFIDYQTKDKLKSNEQFILATDFEFANRINFFIKHVVDLDQNDTELCQIMNKEKSDKGSSWHNYTQLYYFLLKDSKYEKLNIFEVGIGTNNTDVPSNMSEDGTPGASLRGWRNFFPNSIIYGADIDKRALFAEDRIKTFFVDQLNPKTIHDMWHKIGPQKFDLIIDDGLHTYEANTIFLEHSFNKLKQGGLYIIEDIVMSDKNIIDFYSYMIKKGYDGVIVKIPNKHNNYDNCLVILRKKVIK